MLSEQFSSSIILATDEVRGNYERLNITINLYYIEYGRLRVIGGDLQ
jgi:hypothetical protein